MHISQAMPKPQNISLSPAPQWLQVKQLHLRLSEKTILNNINLALPKTGMTCLIGPSGAGKSSLLRCFNLQEKQWTGKIDINGQANRQWSGGDDALRRFMGLIAQKPAVFPASIAENVSFALSRQQRQQPQQQRIQSCLQQAALWDEVKLRLHAPAHTLSIGQQQRLCLARALALQPRILLLDEPTASLDPCSKALLEESLLALAQHISIVCVTHDLMQAQRLQGQVIFMCDGKIIETATSHTFFSQPQRIETREFLRWSVCDCPNT